MGRPYFRIFVASHHVVGLYLFSINKFFSTDVAMRGCRLDELSLLLVIPSVQIIFLFFSFRCVALCFTLQSVFRFVLLASCSSTEATALQAWAVEGWHYLSVL